MVSFKQAMGMIEEHHSSTRSEFAWGPARAGSLGTIARRIVGRLVAAVLPQRIRNRGVKKNLIVSVWPLAISVPVKMKHNEGRR